MKKLGAYINGDTYGGGTILEKNTFVWYEVFRRVNDMYGNDIYEVSIWSLKGGYPDRRKPDAKFKTTNTELIKNTVIPIKDVVDKYCIEWGDCNWQIKDCTVLCDYRYGHEYISTLSADQFGSNNYSHWEWGGDQAISVLKNATVSRVYRKQKVMFCSSADVLPNTIKEELKKSLEQDTMKSALNSCYGMGDFATTNDFVSNRTLEVSEALKIWENKNKETKTMEKKAMTVTDFFLKDLNGITITSTYSKLDHDGGRPYYIYYPEMEITEDMADTLLTVLLMANSDCIHKVVFNPEKGTTTITKGNGDTITVRCKDVKFDYILGYEMARSKRYIGTNDYNWFNKIKNHRKTRIEYTEKKPTKKGGKK